MPETDADCDDMSKYLVLLLKTIRSGISWSARCVGHCEIMWSAVCSVAPQSQFQDGERLHFINRQAKANTSKNYNNDKDRLSQTKSYAKDIFIVA